MVLGVNVSSLVVSLNFGGGNTPSWKCFTNNITHIFTFFWVRCQHILVLVDFVVLLGR
jgi:hypothetical protein